MEVGEQHRHRPVGGNLVQVVAVEPLGRQEDRVEPPGDDRRIGRQARGMLFQPLDHLLDGGLARGRAPLRVDTVVIARIGVFPDPPGHHVGMPLDEAGHQRRVGKALVQVGLAPLRGAIGVTDGEDSPVPDCHMRGLGPVAIHGDDLLGAKTG